MKTRMAPTCLQSQSLDSVVLSSDARVLQPVAQQLDALNRRDLRRPARHLLQLAGIGAVVALIPLPPISEAHLRFNAGQLSDQIQDIQKTDSVGWPTTDIECLARQLIDMLLQGQESRYQIVHEQDVEHLFSIAIQRDRLSLERAYQEMRHPALIFGSELMRAINTTHAQRRRRQAHAAGIIDGVLISPTFRAAIRAMEIKTVRFADTVLANFRVQRLVALPDQTQRDIRQGAIDLIGGGEDNRGRLRLPSHCFQEVEGAAQIDIEIA